VQLQHLVRLIEALGAQRARVGRGGHGLTSTSHAASGAGHHFDQVVYWLLPALTCSATTRALRSPWTMASLSCAPLTVMVAFAQAGIAAHLLELNLLQFLARHLLRGVAQNGLGDSARVAEDHSGSGVEAEGHIEGFGLQRVED